MEQYKCRFCNGKGSIWIESRDGFGVASCVVCSGDKTVDWVTNITQREKINGLNLSHSARHLREDGYVYFEYKHRTIHL